ncbi:MAG: proline--tRNA ligase [Chlamydiales bacterium]
MKQHAISPTREEDFPEWYQQVLKAADLAENSPVRGCMVIKPWGYAIWENMQQILDAEIKKTGHLNAYFPLFIPLSFLEKEAKHVEGFAKECAVVTHHRLEQKDGKLVPTGELEEPLVVRPTSEMIIGDCFSRWIQSYRDLPLLINQWANVVRWEMRPRIFLRTTEFLWQEGHTAHATEDEALKETLKMLKVYTDFVENVLAMPVIAGEKSEGERFPGAEKTFTFEAMMQDRKALQGGTSHYLGQNFSKAQNIQFSDVDGSLKHPYTTSWGMTTRLIGALIMMHGDDDGLRLPPRITPKHVVIIPVIPREESAAEVNAYVDKVAAMLNELSYRGKLLQIHVDRRDIRGGEKNWEWIKKGVPVRIEIGPRDLENQSVMVSRRDRSHKDKVSYPISELSAKMVGILEEIQQGLYVTAQSYRDEHTYTDIADFEELLRFFTPQNQEKPEIHGGFVRAKWCGDIESEERLKQHKLTIRCLPNDQSGTEATCVITGKKAVKDVIIAKAY